MKLKTSHVIALFSGLIPASAFAYVGPGAGLTMLGSLWGLIIAIVFVVFGLLILPIKIMRNKIKKQKAEAEAEAEASRNASDNGKTANQETGLNSNSEQK